MVKGFYEDNMFTYVTDKTKLAAVMVDNWINSAFGFLSRHVGSKLVP